MTGWNVSSLFFFCQKEEKDLLIIIKSFEKIIDFSKNSDKIEGVEAKYELG